MKTGDLLTVEIESINSEGEGVARYGEEKYVLFVPGALPGERVVCRVQKATKRYATTAVQEIVHASPDRTIPPCPLYGKCGGCQLQHAAYDAQLRFKSQILVDALERIGGIRGMNAVSCTPSPLEWGYRNKTTLPVGSVFKNGKRVPLSGYYARRSHEIIPFAGCPILLPSLERTVRKLLPLLNEAGLGGYDERKGSGDVRHIAARCTGAEEGGEILTALVTAHELRPRELGRLKNLHQQLGAQDAHLVGSALNLKTGSGNFIWGPTFQTLYGKRVLTQPLGPYRFHVDISAFFQVNAPQATAMFSHVRALLADLGSAPSILELYSGVGALTIFLAAGTDVSLDAVEEWRPAVRLLKENLELNKVANVRVHSGSAEAFMSDPERVRLNQYDVVVLDPPRTGCDSAVLEGILHIAPRRVVYVSCNPATLARDLSRLLEGGYGLADIRAYDMFPQTAHVECVALLTRK